MTSIASPKPEEAQKAQNLPPVRLVAEIGVNHEGDVATARRLVEEAATSGVWAIKFQVYRAHRFVSLTDPERRARAERFSVDPLLLAELTATARAHGVEVFSSLLSDDVASLLQAQSSVMKIASGDLTCQPLVTLAASTSQQLIISTGGSTFDEIDRTVTWAEHAMKPVNRSERLVLMHCVSGYPVPASQANLRAIPALRARYPDLTIGYSHHVIGVDAIERAVTLGASVVEFHFTHDKNRTTFRDHALSLERDDVVALQQRLHDVIAMLGDGQKCVMPVEEGSMVAMRRSVMTARDVPRGTTLAWGDLICGRPASGIPPWELRRLLGTVTQTDLPQGTLLSWDHVVDPAKPQLADKAVHTVNTVNTASQRAHKGASQARPMRSNSTPSDHADHPDQKHERSV